MTILCNDWECVFNREGICTAAVLDICREYMTMWGG